MKSTQSKLLSVLAFGLMLLPVAYSSAQEPQKQPDVYEQAENEADRLQHVLNLEDWQPAARFTNGSQRNTRSCSGYCIAAA